MPNNTVLSDMQMGDVIRFETWSGIYQIWFITTYTCSLRNLSIPGNTLTVDSILMPCILITSIFRS